MAKNIYDLPEDSLASIDETGHRINIHPAPANGVFKKYKNTVQFILVIFFLILPWIKVGGHQAVLLNIPERKFALFGLTFWAHDGPLIWLVLASALLTLSFVTALWGRVWCGWACPQTVFIEGVYRRIEAFIEGNHLQRRKLDQAPLSANKVIKKFLKWSAFLGVSLVITHSFLAYFVGTDRLLEMIQRPPNENWTSFMVIVVTTGIILFDFAWFREQFCIIACPYGRFQSVLMDDNSMAVLYDDKRGEPRKGQVPEGQNQGDCINCFKCVAVCPTGVDIRRGVQMECIACTACIDACDEVMEKINKPKGLIRYSTEAEIAGGLRKFWRPRVFVYLALILTLVSTLVVLVSNRQALHIAVLRSKEVPFRQVTTDGGTAVLLNQFKLHVKNQTFAKIQVHLRLPEKYRQQSIELVAPINPIPIEPGKTSRTPVFVKFPSELTELSGNTEVSVVFSTTVEGDESEIDKSFTLLGPIRAKSN